MERNLVSTITLQGLKFDVESLPTKENLVHHTIINGPPCDRCSNGPEISLHAMWSCAILNGVWLDSKLWGFRRHSNFVDFKKLISWIIQQHKDLVLFAMTAWSIWT